MPFWSCLHCYWSLSIGDTVYDHASCISWIEQEPAVLVADAISGKGGAKFWFVVEITLSIFYSKIIFIHFD